LLEDAHPLYRWLARMEERLYRAIPLPDLILSLNVPLEVAVQRNLTRAKPGGPEPTEYLRRRHAQCATLDFPGVPLYRVHTDGSLMGYPFGEGPIVLQKLTLADPVLLLTAFGAWVSASRSAGALRDRQGRRIVGLLAAFCTVGILSAALGPTGSESLIELVTY